MLVVKLDTELKETLEIFREENIEKVRKQIDKAHGEDVKDALVMNYQMFKNADHEQLLKLYIAFHQTMKKEQEKGIRLNNSTKRRMIETLKEQRNHFDDALQELGGRRFREDLFDADTMNDMIRAEFDDIVSALRKGDLGLAERWAKEGAEKEWLTNS